MKYLHGQITVRDFEKWKSALEEDISAQEEAGLRLIHLWRSINAPGHAFHPGQAFFVMEVQDVERARKYLNQLPINWARKGMRVVLRWEWHFTEDVALPVA